MNDALLAFVSRHVGTAVDFDGWYGAQCEDLVQVYLRDVLKVPKLAGNAVDAWRNQPPAGMERVSNGPLNYPQPGDVVIWGPSPAAGTGAFGHIAIALAASARHLLTFDQNWPAGALCRVVLHDYAGVLGWLHPHA